MKIRELRVRNFRNVKDEMRTISFADEATGLVRPLTVLVGSNGSGKSSVLDALEALFRYAVQDDDNAALGEITARGFAQVSLEFPEGPPGVDTIVAPASDQGELSWLYRSSELALWQGMMMRGEIPLQGGLLIFPHDRWIKHEHHGAIEPAEEEPEWIFRFSPSQAWHGSLSHLWVWANYLDLEAHAESRPNLVPFVGVIERILGDGQTVKIRKGRVWIARPALGDEIEPHLLPAGQQQILTLFGEIARRLRPRAVLLIDEVEISLHPGLQRVVISHLRELAAEYDLQIILTTHSMEIVNSVAPHEVVNLDAMVAEERARASTEDA